MYDMSLSIQVYLAPLEKEAMIQQIQMQIAVN